MSDVHILPSGSIGQGFIPPQYLPQGESEFYLRNRQSPHPAGYWRPLRQREIETLLRLGNEADDWTTVLVADPFTVQNVRDCSFHGLVRLGKLEDVVLEHHDLRTPAGLSHSRIIACDLGDNVAVHHARYLAHYIVGDRAILLNVDEMHVSDHAKFGSGILKDGEEEAVRVWMDLVNETGARAVLPFDGMLPADAWLWAKHRDDAALLERLKQLTQARFDTRRGYYGTVGDGCVIKNTGIVKDVNVGPACYIKGANKLKNLTVHSSDEEPTQIGEGVELVNGIIGPGCHIFYGCKAVRFIMGPGASLKYGARLIHSFLGDNSTVSCCELLNNLIFPAHEQHHNNSFLTASAVLGQSNIAAGATIGSNHNSRANDGEIQAGRGFWPGLCVTVKHPCRFASFTLLVKGDYPSELDVPLPFSMVANDASADRLLVMPAYWWMYNMYALARNSWKFQDRDKRKVKSQHIEFDCLAPDTAEEVIRARELLGIWMEQARNRAVAAMPEPTSTGEHAVDRIRDMESELSQAKGTGPLPPDGLIARAVKKSFALKDQEVLGESIENSKRKVVVLKPEEGCMAYSQMLNCYAARNLLAWMKANPGAKLADMCQALAGPAQREWENLGGQLVPREDAGRLRADIRSGKLASWDDVHKRYDELWSAYHLQKQRHAMAVLDLLWIKPVRDTIARLAKAKPAVSQEGNPRAASQRAGVPYNLRASTWDAFLTQAIQDQHYVRDQVYLTRRKDYEDPFRKSTFANPQEMLAVLGDPEKNGFIKQVRRETDEFEALVEEVRKRG
jgi:hypothetical protein